MEELLKGDFLKRLLGNDIVQVNLLTLQQKYNQKE